jgi:undecaprenyl-diphosphatase
MGMIEGLERLDQQAFLAINGLHADRLDAVMLSISDMFLWFPLYVFLLYLLQRMHGWRGLGIGVLVIAAMITVSDSGSVMLFKNTVQRLRPCHTPGLMEAVHLVGDCGGRYGFISSHAANHFAIALFMGLQLRTVVRWALHALIAWAAVVAYSRIYLGVHFPGDVLAGALYGSLVGILFQRSYQYLLARSVA